MLETGTVMPSEWPGSLLLRRDIKDETRGAVGTSYVMNEMHTPIGNSAAESVGRSARCVTRIP